MNSDSKIIIDNSRNKIEVPIEGSLGLLALGAVGLLAWREKKKKEGVLCYFNLPANNELQKKE